MANKTAPARFSDYMQSGPIKVTIDTGAAKTTYHLAIDLLKAHSPYLAGKINAVLQKPRRSNDDNLELSLPAIRLAPFEQFIEYILAQPLITAVSHPILLVDTYLLAHRLESYSMRNALLDTLCTYHATNPTGPIGLGPAMLRLADALPPDGPHGQSKNLLLKFMVHQLTYKIFHSGWEAYRLSKPFESLLRRSVKVVYWHLDALHEMQKAACPVSAIVDDSDGRRTKADLDGDDDGWEEVAGGVGFAVRAKKRLKKGKGGWVPNPALRGLEGCTYHEHPRAGGGGGGEKAKCGFQAVDLTEDAELSD